MALPDSRNTTYTPGTQLKSVDMNEIQDGIINAAHGDILIQVPLTRPPDGHNNAAVYGHFITPNADGNTMSVDLPVKNGDTLKAVYAIVRNPDSKPIVLNVQTRAYTGNTDGGGTGSIASLGTFPQSPTVSNTFLQIIGASGLNYTVFFDPLLTNFPERVWAYIELADITNELWELYCIVNRPLTP